MSDTVDKDQVYEIRVRGHVDTQWKDWFAGLDSRKTFTPEGEPITILCGEVADQSALSGILVQINDMNLRLISVNPIGD